MEKNEQIYRHAMNELFHLTHEKFEHDENKAIELFEKLLKRNISIHPDLLKEIAQEVYIDEYDANKLYEIYDCLHIRQQNLNNQLLNDDQISKIISLKKLSQ